MAVTAKFQIHSSTRVMMHNSEGKKVPGYTIIAHPVYTGSEENKKFFESTPSGKLELGVINKLAADELELGSYILITMEQVPE